MLHTAHTEWHLHRSLHDDRSINNQYFAQAFEVWSVHGARGVQVRFAPFHVKPGHGQRSPPKQGIRCPPTYFVSLVTGHQLILQSAKRNSTATDRSRFCIDCVTNRRVHTTSRDSICFVRGIVSNWIERAKWQATVKQQPAAGWVLLSVVGIKFCKSCLSWMSVGSLTAMWREITSLSNISVISRSTAGCYL